MSYLTSTLKKMKLIEEIEPTSLTQNSLDPDTKKEPDDALEKLNSNISSNEPNPKPSNPIENKNDVPSNEDFKIDTIDKIQEISAIYKEYDMNLGTINTVFMIDEFIKALPENLPIEVKKQSILTIIAATGTNLDNLLKDGSHRLNVLDTFKKDFCTNINEKISKHKVEIKNLTQLITQYNMSIEKSEKLLAEQSVIIEYEQQKIEDILSFINS